MGWCRSSGVHTWTMSTSGEATSSRQSAVAKAKPASAWARRAVSGRLVATPTNSIGAPTSM